MGEDVRDNRFDAAWLKARETADGRSRNMALVESVRLHFAIRADMAILDLACGIGSNVRQLYTFLPTFQRWMLVEKDRSLLDHARSSLSAWADQAKPKSRRDDVLVLEKGEYRIEVTLRAADNTRQLDQLLELWPDLVIASTLIDLMARPDLEQLAEKLVHRRIPIYASHIANGDLEWYPENRTDPLILQAIAKNSARDRGFGPSLGPRAFSMFTEALRSRGATVETGSSKWNLNGADDREVMIWLADECASLAADSRLVPETVAGVWAQSRAMAETALVGYQDLFATF
jgi:hypothetical protein